MVQANSDGGYAWDDGYAWEKHTSFSGYVQANSDDGCGVEMDREMLLITIPFL